MGPRLVSRGRHPPPNTEASGTSPASMGPRLVSRGRRLDQARLELAHAPASMGPRLVSRGRRRRSWIASFPALRFNGATAGEPWKTLASRSRPAACGRASMGPRLVSRGRRGERPCPRRRRFNGATAGEPWKTSPTWQPPSIHASMGPRLVSRGRRPFPQALNGQGLGGHPARGWACEARSGMPVVPR